MRKNLLREYARFSRKSRLGIITLLGMILLLTLIPFLFPLLYPPPDAGQWTLPPEPGQPYLPPADTTGRVTRNDTRLDEKPGNALPTPPARLFFFDPNTLPDEGWHQLGLKEKTIRTIRNYLSKGGRFRKAEDIRKIWGLPAATAEQLIPFIRLEEPAVVSDKQNFFQQPAAKKITRIDINSADTSEWKELPGIGSKLAARIVAFRDKLGGFYQPGQVSETYGLPDSVFQKILPRLTLQAGSIRKLNINTATVDELKVHPYLKYTLANAIVQYRQQHGPYKSMAELRNIVLINEEQLQKITPYLVAE